MNFAWTAVKDDEDNEFEFGGTVQAEPVETHSNGITFIDYRPVFSAAHREAVARHGQNVTVTEVSWVEHHRQNSRQAGSD